ncbi:hypothetical protein V500_00723 [Pseudogymnoascus sp. VKM F-4518 (FW-2643)]|nr:hypothetical protein V500_00723 [Pseudogymnoascus sp. VKM F-4518 (FW-2643)]
MASNDINAEDILNGSYASTRLRPASHVDSTSHPPQPRKFDSNDLFIAVMGVTGSGKSTFISKCTGHDVGIGHSLKSHTSNIEIYSYKYNDKTIHLIDTPGFDDTFKPDIEVLQTAAIWLSEAYQKDLLLTGIIYLHRISDARMGGTARKDLTMFKKLCGEDSFSNVVLATTHWEKVSAVDGERREAELESSTEFYGTMVRRGSKMMRHMDNAASAKAIVAYLINKQKTTVLNIQREMAEDGICLKETEAGRVLQSDIIRRTEQLDKKLKDTEEQMNKAIQEKNDALVKELADQQQELNDLKAAAQKGSEQLNVKMEDLFREKNEKFKKAMKELDDERKERERIIAEKTKEHDDFKAKVIEAEELAEKRRMSTEAEINNTKKELDQATDDNYRLLAAFLQTIMEQEEIDKRTREEGIARAKEELERQKAEIQNAQIKLQQAFNQQAARPEFYQGEPPPYQQYQQPPQQMFQQQMYPQQLYSQNLGPDTTIAAVGAGLGALGAAGATAMLAPLICNIM